jgi:dienelactone hydrolase
MNARTVSRSCTLAALLIVCVAVAPGRAAAQEAAAQLRVIPVPEPVAETPLQADTQGEIWFDSRTPFDFDLLLNHLDEVSRTSTLGYLYLPDGASADAPVPAMVLLPGSGGVKLGRQMLHANNLVAAGYAVLVVDYYASRNVNDDTVPYAVMILNVTEFDVVVDGYSALRALNRHPAIDPSRIGVMGFSYGGMATRLAMDARLKELLAPEVTPFAVHVDYYGPCFQKFNTAATTGAPLLTLRGAHDASNDLVQCAIREQELRVAGSEVSSKIYATAGHSWDNLGKRHVNSSTYLSGCEMVFDDRGYPSVDGVAMITPSDPTDRAERFAMRLRSGSFFGDCVKRGYIVGRDQPVYEDSTKELIRFLDEKL